MKEYKNEEEFLNDYNANHFETLSMTTDILLVSVSDQKQSNYRKTSKKMMSILLVKRKQYPFKDKWNLPGGFLDPRGETLDECAIRVLKNDTNLSHVFLEQLYTFDDIDRDPRTRVVNCAYVALIDKNKLDEALNEDAAWFDVVEYDECDDYIEMKLTNGEENINFKVNKVLRSQTSTRYKYETVENDMLSFDNPLVIVSGLSKIRSKANYSDIVFNMMPEYFTLGELQQVYEIILNKKLLDPAFRRIIKSKVEKTNIIKKGEGHRPSYLYKYKGNE